MEEKSSLDRTVEEETLLEKHLAFYEALASGQREPNTAAQQHFVSVCQGRAKATTLHELAYVKYRMWRMQQTGPLQADGGDIDEFGEGVPRPGWFTEADARAVPQ